MEVKTFSDFIRDVAKRESSGDYSVKNKFGYMGAFQFGRARLSDFGLTKRGSGGNGSSTSSFEWVPPFTEEGFLASKLLQDNVFLLHVKDLIRAIGRICPPAVDGTFQGVTITLSGAIACCHLLGTGGLKSFIAGSNKADALGTTAKDYIELFNGYTIPARESIHISRKDLEDSLTEQPLA